MFGRPCSCMGGRTSSKQMFLPLVQALERRGLPCRLFVAYLERHVSLDGEAHGPQSRALLDRLCARDRERRREGERAAVEALLARKRLWDAIAEGVPSRVSVVAPA